MAAEEKWREEIALKHFLKYCTSEKCIRGPEHQKKANWHEGFCLECEFNPYNMKILKRSAGTGSTCANPSGADLRCKDLSDADLSGADLRGADLRCKDLSGADLKCKDLSDADLSGADLRGADLRCADLSDANLRHADLSGADLRCGDLSGADLSGANLSGANLRCADLSDANLRHANLKCADLSDANLRHANLSDTNLRHANLSGADLRYADLSVADLSGAKGILNPIEYLEKNFEKTEEGIIVYKSFNENCSPNPNWKIAEGSIIEEVVNPLPTVEGGCGINVATKEWAKRKCRKQIWKCLIRWEWLVGVVIPYQTDGVIRASKVQLIKPVYF